MTDVKSNKAENAFTTYHDRIEAAYSEFTLQRYGYEETLRARDEYISEVYSARAQLLADLGL